MGVETDVNRAELRRYVQRVSDRWPLERALVSGTRVIGDGQDPDFFVVLVSPGFDGVPWLERVHQAESLWDAAEMGARAVVHCYTPVEFERKLRQLPQVRQAADKGIDVTA